MSAFKYCPFIWMFCNKTPNNQINKIQKRTLLLLYEMEYYKITRRMFILIEIYKSINYLSPPIMKDFFDLKNA